MPPLGRSADGSRLPSERPTHSIMMFLLNAFRNTSLCLLIHSDLSRPRLFAAVFAHSRWAAHCSRRLPCMESGRKAVVANFATETDLLKEKIRHLEASGGDEWRLGQTGAWLLLAHRAQARRLHQTQQLVLSTLT